MLAHGHVEMCLENCWKLILAHGHDYYDKDVPKNRMKNQWKINLKWRVAELDAISKGPWNSICFGRRAIECRIDLVMISEPFWFRSDVFDSKHNFKIDRFLKTHSGLEGSFQRGSRTKRCCGGVTLACSIRRSTPLVGAVRRVRQTVK